jgi:hypothetical protein
MSLHGIIMQKNITIMFTSYHWHIPCLRHFHTFWPICSSKKGVKIMRGIFGIRFRGDFQVRSGIRYPIHKLETKHFSVII